MWQRVTHPPARCTLFFLPAKGWARTCVGFWVLFYVPCFCCCFGWFGAMFGKCWKYRCLRKNVPPINVDVFKRTIFQIFRISKNDKNVVCWNMFLLVVWGHFWPYSRERKIKWPRNARCLKNSPRRCVKDFSGLNFLFFFKILFGPKSRRQGTYLDEFLMDFRQIASGVRFRGQKP